MAKNVLPGGHTAKNGYPLIFAITSKSVAPDAYEPFKPLWIVIEFLSRVYHEGKALPSNPYPCTMILGRTLQP